MISFFEKKEQMKYSVINFLYEQEQQVSIEVIALNVQLSTVKVSDILTELTQDFIHYFPDYDINEQFYRNNFNQVIKGAQFSIDLFSNMLLKESIFCDFMMDLLHERVINHDIYAANRNISLSTVKREWRTLKDNLAKYDICIEKEQGLFKLKGNEEHIRYLILIIIFYSDYPIQAYLTRDDLTFYESSTLKNTNEQSLKFLNTMLYISLTRIKKEHIVSDEAGKHLLLNILISEKNFREHFEDFYKSTKLSINDYEQEINYMFFFSNILTLINKQAFEDMEIYVPNNFFENSLFSEVNPIVQEMIKIFDLKITSNEYFYLMSNLSLSIRKRIVFGATIDLDFNFSGLNGYPAFVKKLSPSLRHHSAIDTRHLFAIFYSILDKKKKTISILVASRLGLESQVLIQEKLQLLIKNPIHFVQFMEDKPDIVVTDLFIDTKDIPRFLIKPYPTLKELHKLAVNISSIVNRDNILY